MNAVYIISLIIYRQTKLKESIMRFDFAINHTSSSSRSMFAIPFFISYTLSQFGHCIYPSTIYLRTRRRWRSL